jgi:FkbM family methyltransferase
MSDLAQSFIIKIATLLNVNLLGTAHKGIGVGSNGDIYNSGESNFVKKYLSKLIIDKYDLIVDVGMNKGEYTSLVSSVFPNNPIHGFEPNITLIPSLKTKFSNQPNINIHNVAISDKSSNMKIYVYEKDHMTGHGSLNKEVFSVFHKTDKIKSIDTRAITLKQFCDENRIDRISFLKLDIEGHEYKALKSLDSQRMNKIKAIQIEFNEMNILEKVFLRDFVKLLCNFNLYRIKPKGLIPLKEYNPSMEIFRFQNIVFINKELDPFE